MNIDVAVTYPIAWLCGAILLVAILFVVALWKIYVKAGEPGWVLFIPIYNQVKFLEITSSPLWWILLLFFVPIVNLVLWVVVTDRLARGFGKGRWFTAGLLLLPIIFYPILGFGKSKYKKPLPAPKKMSEAVKWSLISALVIVLLQIPLFMLGAAAGFILAHATVDSTEQINIPIQDETYMFDGSFIYYGGKPLPNADMDTFELLGDFGYAKDINAVYYEGEVIEDADPETFILEDGTFKGIPYEATDKNHYYWFGTRLYPPAQ